MTRSWTHFDDIGQLPELSCDFHRTLLLICIKTHFGDIGEFPHLFHDFQEILTLSGTGSILAILAILRNLLMITLKTIKAPSH